MQLYRFDSSVGQPIDSFGSVNGVLSKIARLGMDTQLSCIYLGRGGRIGVHPAAAPQLFLVVQGQGLVRGEGTAGLPIAPGQAAFWQQGEQHEVLSASGLTAIVLEGPALDPSAFMPLA